MAANTLVLTGANLASIVELGNAISMAAATAGIDNRAAGTFTILDTSTASPPWTITSVDATGTSRTFKVG